MDYKVKIKRQNGNEEEYIIHHGVKGMKWGVRRAAKANGRAIINTYRHPLRTMAATSAMSARDGVRTTLRRNAVGYKTKELEEINRRVAKMNKSAKASKMAKKVAKAKVKAKKKAEIDAIDAQEWREIRAAKAARARARAKKKKQRLG